MIRAREGCGVVVLKRFSDALRTKTGARVGGGRPSIRMAAATDWTAPTALPRKP